MSWKKVYYLVLAGLITTLSLVLVYSDQGLVRLKSLRHEQEKLQAENLDYLERNRRLMKQIERVKKDREYIEDLARKKLGLIRPNETIYRLREEPDGNYPATNG